MYDDNIVIRRAELSDVDAIWELARAEGCRLSEAYIVTNIDSFYVLLYRKRILGVLCGKPNPGREKAFWVVVHPMFPHSSVGAALTNCIQGVFFREPLRKLDKAATRPVLLRLFDKFVSYFKLRGVINGISGKQKL